MEKQKYFQPKEKLLVAILEEDISSKRNSGQVSIQDHDVAAFATPSLSSPALTPGSISKRNNRNKSEREVLVGTPVKEGHVNYMLMYDMLTGIRISVSRCNAKPIREAVDSDFTAAHKLAFDV
jgi:hypothetical protein